MPVSRHVAAVITAFAVGLLAIVLWHTGAADLTASLVQVGWGFVWVVALGGLRFVARSEAWRLTFDGQARPRLQELFSAFLAGDALSNLTALGPIASEPLKGAYIGGGRAPGTVAATLAIENVGYAVSVLLMLIVSGCWILTHAAVSVSVSRMLFCTIAASAAAIVLAAWLLSGSTGRFAPHRGPGSRRVLGFIINRLRDCRTWRPLRLTAIAACELAFHVAAVLETWLVLGWLVGSDAASMGHAIAIEGVGRFITVVFKFIPLRVGVDEVGSGWISLALGLGSGVGVAIALVRKGRAVVWAVVGLLLLLRSPAVLGPGAPRAAHRIG